MCLRTNNTRVLFSLNSNTVSTNKAAVVFTYVCWMRAARMTVSLLHFVVMHLLTSFRYVADDYYSQTLVQSFISFWQLDATEMQSCFKFRRFFENKWNIDVSVVSRWRLWQNMRKCPPLFTILFSYRIIFFIISACIFFVYWINTQYYRYSLIIIAYTFHIHTYIIKMEQNRISISI